MVLQLPKAAVAAAAAVADNLPGHVPAFTFSDLPVIVRAAATFGGVSAAQPFVGLEIR
jgi:hypothetical protein